MAAPLVPFEDAIVEVSGGNVKTPQSNYLDSGTLPIVDQGKRLVGGYSDDPGAAYSGDLPAVVFGDHTCVLKYVDFRFGLGADGVKVLRPLPGWEPRYVYSFLRTGELPDAGYSRHYK